MMCVMCEMRDRFHEVTCSAESAKIAKRLIAVVATHFPKPSENLVHCLVTLALMLSKEMKIDVMETINLLMFHVARLHPEVDLLAIEEKYKGQMKGGGGGGETIH